MSDELLDNDDSLPDVKFLTFLRCHTLYFYLIMNISLLVLIYCISPMSYTYTTGMLFIYVLNNLWLLLSYLDWRKNTIEKHNKTK